MATPEYRGDWIRVRRLILERDGWVCQIKARGCTEKATAVDHIVAVSRGGPPLAPNNLRACCVSCNTGRANRERHERASRNW